MKTNKSATDKTRIPILKIAVVMLLLNTASCVSFETAVRGSLSDAINTAAERQLSGMLAGYTDVMLYQLAYTQVFLLGGFGTHPEYFGVGEGATWQVEFVDHRESGYFTAERALLSREDDGSGWWFLRYVPEDEEPLEFEILIDRDYQAREMYLRDPETGEIRHHQFEFNESELREAEDSEVALQEAGYHTRPVFIENRDRYLLDRTNVIIGDNNYETELLSYTIEDPDTEATFEYRWWVTSDVPGELVKFEYEDIESGGILRGRMIGLRQDYRSVLR